MRVILVPYKMGSTSCKNLKEAIQAEGIRCLRIYTDSTKYKYRKSDKLIYYGGTDVLPSITTGLNYNRQLAMNKLNAFRAFNEADISCVPWTTDKTATTEWETTVCRATLTGHSGEGISIVEKGQELPNVPLYTQYIKKTFECRIHVFNGKVIDAQIKRKRRDLPEDTELDTKVRNVHTGWVYCRDGFTPDDTCTTLAIDAVTAVKLDFGAVDIIYNKYYNKYYVLEVNTAPGLEGTTLTNYVKEICHET